jgi:rhomboid protease GluP
MDGISEAQPGVDETEIGFRRPPLFTRQLLWTPIFGGLAFAAGFFSTGGSNNPLAWAFYGTYLFAFLLVLVSRQAWLRHQGGLLPMRFSSDVLALPRNAASRAMASIRYGDVRSVTLAGRGGGARLILDAGGTRYVYSVRLFAAPDAPARIASLMRARILSLPDGAAQWHDVDRRQVLAARITPLLPWGTYGVAGLVVLVYALQALLRSDDNLRLLDFGADAPLLVWGGQAWRLATANLLHANLAHVTGNVLFLIIFGRLLERLVGTKHFLLLLLVTGVLSVGASTLAAPLQHNFIYAVGLSGAIYGIIGALGLIALRFGRQLPGGYRLTARTWTLLLLLCAYVTFVSPDVNRAAHLAGMLFGALLGWLMFRRRTDAATLRQPSAVARVALVCVGLFWAGSLAATVLHGTSQAARRADRIALMRGVLNGPLRGAAVENELAWAVAEDPSAPPAAVADAQLLAGRALDQVKALPKRFQWQLPMVSDTVAVLNYRVGDYALAVELQAPLAIRYGPVYGSHLAWMLDRAVQAHGAVLPASFGIGAQALRLERGLLVVTIGGMLSEDVELLALMRRQGRLAGVLQVYVAKGFSGSQILPLPEIAYRAPRTTPPDAMWLDGKSDIQTVWVRRVASGADTITMAPHFGRYDPVTFPLP